MVKQVQTQGIRLGAIVVAGIMAGSMDAHAQQNLSTVVGNIGASSAELPGLVTGTSYIMGTVIGTLGILKIKDHVENPSGTPLKEGAIRLLTGGALLTVPTVLDVVQTTIDGNAVSATSATDVNVNAADFGTN